MVSSMNLSLNRKLWQNDTETWQGRGACEWPEGVRVGFGVLLRSVGLQTPGFGTDGMLLLLLKQLVGLIT